MAQATDEVWAALVKAADNMARFYDIHQRDAPKYNVGDKVWLSSENIRTVRPTKKFDYKWLGPYVIEWVISCNAYRLKLPTSFSQVHPVFSVTLLRPFKCNQHEGMLLVRVDKRQRLLGVWVETPSSSEGRSFLLWVQG